MHLPEGAKAYLVESDVYGICEQIAEISPRLHVFLLTDDAKYAYAITEHCEDNVERLVFKVKELDGRVIKRLRTLMAKPLLQRLDEIEKENHRFEQQELDDELERLYEELGRPMWTQLEHDGFIQRSISYPKAGVATRGRRPR